MHLIGNTYAQCTQILDQNHNGSFYGYIYNTRGHVPDSRGNGGNSTAN